MNSIRKNTLVSESRGTTIKFNYLKNWPTTASFCLFRAFQTQFYAEKTEGFSVIWTQTVGVEDEHADHFTTTTALHAKSDVDKLLIIA